MKRNFVFGICLLCAGMALQQPVMADAKETVMDAISDTTDYEGLLSAGVGDLFSSKLTEDQYKEIAKQAEGARWGYTNLGICNVEENNLNVRQEPDENGKLVGKLPKNAACEILESDGEWAYISSGKV